MSFVIVVFLLLGICNVCSKPERDRKASAVDQPSVLMPLLLQSQSWEGLYLFSPPAQCLFCRRQIVECDILLTVNEGMNEFLWKVFFTLDLLRVECAG